MPKDNLVEFGRTSDDTLNINQLANGNLLRSLWVNLDPGYHTAFQAISDYWARNHLVQVSPFLLQGKIQHAEVREISCALRGLKAKNIDFVL